MTDAERDRLWSLIEAYANEAYVLGKREGRDDPFVVSKGAVDPVDAARAELRAALGFAEG